MINKNKNKNKKICISICSYRDFDVYNTIDSLFKNANNYKNIFIYVYLQDSIYTFYKSFFCIKNIYRQNVFIKTTSYKNAKGPLYARQYIIQNMIKPSNKFKMFNYYLQLDSHMRFIPNWDIILINNYENLFPEKKIISYYPPGSFLEEKEKIPVLIEKEKIHNDRIDKYKTRFINSNIIRNYFSSEYIAAGFFFTEIKFILYEKKNYPMIEIPYLFQGEEMLLTYYFVKKNNFIIFSPCENIAIHKYTRNNEHKIWNNIENWKELNNKAIEKLNKIIL